MIVKTAAKLIQILPEQAATRLTQFVASRTRRARILPAENDALKSATRIYYGTHRNHVAWSWGRGPTVVLVHGWGGRASQMAVLASIIARSGYRAIAIDVTGHGESPKRHTSWDFFLKDIPGLERTLFQPVYAYVGHSAGGLALMAARKMGRIDARRYICVCAPSYPFPAIDAVRARLAPPNAVLDNYRNHVAEQFSDTWKELKSGSAYAGAGGNLLLVYDESDSCVSHKEGDLIHGWCPGSRLVKTQSHGHNRILSTHALSEATIKFLAKGLF